MVKLGNEAVKRIDPDIGVALGGISSASMEQVQQGESTVAGPDPRTATWSEQAQADDLASRMRTAKRRGVDLAFWASLVENPNVAPIFRREGLIERDTWRRKPAFDEYLKLIAKESNN